MRVAINWNSSASRNGLMSIGSPRCRNFLSGLVLAAGVLASAGVPSLAYAAEEPLVMGIFPRYKAAETTTMFTPLANHLSERLHRKVVLVTSKDFDSFWKGVTERRYHIVHYNQYHYIQSSKFYKVIAHNQ